MSSAEITPEHLARLRRYSGAHDLVDARRTVEMTLEGTRTDADGVERRLTVEIGRDEGRWFVTATDEDGRVALGNPEISLDLTLDVVQWHKLDAGLSAHARRATGGCT